MTGNTLEQRARELLAAEWEADGRTMHAGMIRIGHPAILIEGDTQRALRAIEAAIAQSAQQADADEDAYVIDRLAHLLAEISVIVNGPEPAGTKWSYHDLPEKVAELKRRSS